MVKVENAVQAKELALDFLAKMGLPTWSNEVESIKKSGGNWVIQIKSTRTYGTLVPDLIKLEIEADTGSVISYEKIK